MTRPLLTIRLNRRAVAAVALADEALTFMDGRHLTSRSDRTVEAAARFLASVLALTKPAMVVVDAPEADAGSITGRLRHAVSAAAAGSGVELLPVTKSEVLAAYGIRGVRSRQELRQQVREFWPELTAIRRKVEPFVVDAAAAALYADCRVAVERVAT